MGQSLLVIRRSITAIATNHGQTVNVEYIHQVSFPYDKRTLGSFDDLYPSKPYIHHSADISGDRSTSIEDEVMETLKLPGAARQGTRDWYSENPRPPALRPQNSR